MLSFIFSYFNVQDVISTVFAFSRDVAQQRGGCG